MVWLCCAVDEWLLLLLRMGMVLPAWTMPSSGAFGRLRLCEFWTGKGVGEIAVVLDWEDDCGERLKGAVK